MTLVPRSYDGRIARITNLGGPAYLAVREGRLAYSGNESGPYMQMSLRVLSGSNKGMDGSDTFEHDLDLDELRAELQSGTVDWYGQELELEWLDGQEAQIAKQAFFSTEPRHKTRADSTPGLAARVIDGLMSLIRWRRNR